MTQEHKLSHTPSRLVTRPASDFKALPERGRAGGSSADSQLFTETATGDLWIGKCSNQALSKPFARLPGYSRYYEEYKEWLGLAIYDLLGIPTPTTQLSLVKPTLGTVEDFDYAHPCLHVMSKFVTGFTPFGEHFLAHYQQTVQAETDSTVLREKDTPLP